MNNVHPEVELAAILQCSRTRAKIICDLLEQRGLALYRKRQMRNGRRPNSSTPMTPMVAQQIRKVFEANPHLTQSEVAAQFNVNAGRVAEVLNGEWQ